MDAANQRLFVSHASADAAFAVRLCGLLEARGVRCWMAPRDIPAGGEYRAEIMNGIEACSGMVVLLSRAAAESPFVGSEIERAFPRHKRLYPVFLEAVKLPPALEFTLATFQHVRAWQMSPDEVADAIASAVRGQPVPVRVAAPPKRVARGAWGLVACAAAAAALVWWRADRPDAGRMRGAGPVPPPAAGAQPLRYHAVVIGANAYESHAGEGWTPLRTARQDAEAVAEVLETQYGFTVRRVLDGDATAKGIMVALDELSRLTDTDAALVFFAGHGYYDAPQDEGYWIPVDARKTRDGLPAREDWLWNAMITRLLEVSPARHVLVIADACYSGSLFRGEETAGEAPDPQWYRRAGEAPSRYLITSGGTEPVLDGSGAHSVFAGELLRFLRDPRKPMFSASEVAVAIREKVAQLTGQMVRSGPLAVSSHGGGEFVFTRQGGEPPAVATRVVPAAPEMTEDEQLRSALAMARQGATATAQKWVGGLAASGGADALATAVAGYLDRAKREERRDNLRALIQQVDDQRAAASNTAGRSYADFARPRVLACLGPRAGAGVDEVSAVLYRLTLRTLLEGSGTLRVIEREQLEEVLEELQLGASQLTDARAGPVVGRLLPASLLLLGDVLAEGDGETVYLRLVDTETSQVIASFDGRRARGEATAAACGPLASNLVAKVLQARPLRARVLERTNGRLTAAMGSFHGVREGQALEVRERAMRELAGVADVRETAIGAGRVVALGDMMCDIEPEWSGSPPPETAELWVRERMP